jgi:SAM-dependent methyltransferase
VVTGAICIIWPIGFPRSGFELTARGVELARRIQEIDLPATAYGRLYGLTQGGMDNVRRVSFRQASATDLPVPDGSFDLVFTYAALEQMHDRRKPALSEIRRIAKNHALFQEPFADANDVLGRLYLWSRNYFRMHSSALVRHGLRPIRTWYNLPVKPTFAYGFVLSEPI